MYYSYPPETLARPCSKCAARPGEACWAWTVKLPEPHAER